MIINLKSFIHHDIWALKSLLEHSYKMLTSSFPKTISQVNHWECHTGWWVVFRNSTILFSPLVDSFKNIMLAYEKSILLGLEFFFTYGWCCLLLQEEKTTQVMCQNLVYLYKEVAMLKMYRKVLGFMHSSLKSNKLC